ncbi:MAG: nucleotide pyrophosphohydrolase [Pseudomonadales bacterium]|nr:nucleotide pyrophosphohydrolase [Pseudomonadales bacterium]
MNTIKEIQGALRSFAEERDWNQFHSPKNLATALSVEAAELLEHFQWLSTEASERDALSQTTLSEIEKELADVFLYLLRLSDRLDVDLIEAAQKKLTINAEKYPVSLSKGNAVKYSRRDKDE